MTSSTSKNNILKILDARSMADARRILEKIFPTLELTAENLVSFKNFDLVERLEPILVDIINFPASWHPAESVSTVRRALCDSKKNSDETLEGFLKQINLSAHTLLTAKFEEYHMWTKISATPPGRQSSYTFTINKIRIRLQREVPRKLKLDKFLLGGVGDVDPALPKGGIIAIATGNFRSSNQAGDGLYKAITDLCSIINLSHQRNRKEWSSGKLKPKSKLLLGDNQYLFRDTQSLNSESVWYNPEYRDDFWESSRFSLDDLDKRIKYVRKFLSAIDKNSFGDRIFNSIRMLVDGWTSHDPNHRILRSWTAYEILLSRSQDRADSYEKIARRASFPAKDAGIQQLKFLHAANVRNKYVHQNRPDASAEAIALDLDIYFINLVEWILWNNTKFENHGRLLDVLDLEPNIDVLKRQSVDRHRGLLILNRD